MKTNLRTGRTGRTVVTMTILDFTRITEARDNLKAIYDAASGHVPSVVRRDADAPVAVVNRADLLCALRALCPLDPQVRFGDDAVAVWIEGLPVSAEGPDFDSAANNLIDALRDYAVTWVEQLRHYPNHAENWGVANLALLSSDADLRAHLFGSD